MKNIIKVCHRCGISYGRHNCGVATWHEDICDICGKKAFVTEPRDFGGVKVSDVLTEEKEGVDESWDKLFDRKFCIVDDYGKPDDREFCNELNLPRKVKKFIRQLLGYDKDKKLRTTDVINLGRVDEMIGKIRSIELKPNEYKLLKKLTEALAEKIDEYEMEDMYSNFRQQLRNGK